MSRALSPPPRRGRAPRPERRPALTQERIVAAAMAVLDARGLDGLSMRAVAEALGTGPASLYVHVADKDELLALLVDHVLDGLEPPAPDPDHWQEQLKAVVREAHSGLLAHRDLARGALAHAPLGEAALRFREGMHALMRAGGVPDAVRAHGAGLLWLHAVATAAEQALRAEAGERFAAEVRAYLAALPADRFPDLARLPAGPDESERFEFGLDVLVSGLAAYGRGAR